MQESENILADVINLTGEKYFALREEYRDFKGYRLLTTGREERMLPILCRRVKAEKEEREKAESYGR